MKPHLIDSWQRIVPLRHGLERAVRAAAPVARRFVFDGEASRHVGRLLFEAGDLVAEQIAFAKPPYPHTYLEISDARAMFDGWRPGHDADKTLPGDTKLGLLYVGDRLYTFCENVDVKDVPPTLGMFYVDMGRGQTEKIDKLFPPGKYSTDQIKLSYLLGGMRQPDGNIAMVRADYEFFLANYNLSVVYDRVRNSPALAEAAFLGGGDLLIGAAALLLIHGTKRGVTINNVSHSRGFFKGKSIVFRKHGVVTIRLGKRESIRRLAFGSRESPVVHDVLGTWVDYHRDRHCQHEWYRLEDQDHERYRCEKCPTLRTWRVPHSRGDGTKGIKTKTYSVVE